MGVADQYVLHDKKISPRKWKHEHMGYLARTQEITGRLAGLPHGSKITACREYRFAFSFWVRVSPFSFQNALAGLRSCLRGHVGTGVRRDEFPHGTGLKRRKQAYFHELLQVRRAIHLEKRGDKLFSTGQ